MLEGFLRTTALAGWSILVACAGPPTSSTTPASTAPPAAASVSAAPVAASEPAGPKLPPLPRRTTDPCDVGLTRRDLANGNILRAWRSVEHMSTRCPRVKAEAAKLRAQVSTELEAALPPGRTALALLEDARQAHARGEAVAGRRLAARAIVALEKESGAKLEVVARHQPNQSLEQVSADGGTLVVREVKPTKDLIRDADTVKLVGANDLKPRMFVHLPHATRDMAVSPNGDVFAALDLWGKVHVYRAGTTKPLIWRERKDSPDYAEAIAFFADGHRLLVVSDERVSGPAAIEILDVRDGTRKPMKAPAGLDRVERAYLFPDERSVLVVHELGKTASRIDFHSGRVLGRASGAGSFDAVAISPAGRVALRSLGGVTIWDGTSKKSSQLEVASDGIDFLGMAFSASGNELVVSGTDRGTVTLQLPSGRELAKQAISSRLATEHYSLEPKMLGSAIVSNGARVFAMDERQMQVVDLTDGKVVVDAAVVGAPPLRTVGAGNALASASKVDTLIRVLHPEGLTTVRTEKVCDNCPLALSHDGTRVAAVLRKQVYVASAIGQPAVAVHGRPHAVQQLTFDRTGRLLLGTTDGAEMYVDVLDPRSGKTERLATLEGTRRTLLLTLSPDAEHAVVTDGRKAFALAFAQPGDRHPLDDTRALAYSGDGTYLVSASPGIVRLDPRGRALHPPLDAPCPIRRVRPSHHGEAALLHCDDELHVVRWAGGRPVVTRIGAVHGLPPIHEASPFDPVATLSGHGHLVFDPFADGGTAILDARDGRRIARVRDLQGRAAAVVEHTDGRIQLIGADADSLREELLCRVGPHPVPFELCADGLVDEELLLEVLGSSDE